MRTLKRARFQEAAVRHIVGRFEDPAGSKRVLLADEVGLGKTVVARGVIEKLQERRRKPLTVIYLCSNAEIAEQNRTKLDPESGTPVGRVTELALEARAQQSALRLYSFTPGTSLRDGTGMEWERRLLMYLLYRAFGLPVWKQRWREFFRCGVRPARWHEVTSRRALWTAFKGKTKKSLQRSLAAAWRTHEFDGQPPHVTLTSAVAAFDPESDDSRASRNRMIAQLRRVMQTEILRDLKPDLLILDEVQRFRDVLEQATNQNHITAALFARRVPVLILSATPYRALTLGHELTEGIASHHKDFFKTLDFLFDRDVETPARIRSNLQVFGDRLPSPNLADTLDGDLLALKHRLEDDLRKVICRTERNWYVLDRRKGIDDSMVTAGEMPGRLELEEFFRLQHALAPLQAASQITEFWKSAPSLLTFMDARYAVFRKMRDDTNFRVPRGLLTTGNALVPLGERNHRVSKALAVALGAGEARPSLWTAPSYAYYRDDLFGSAHGRKLLVFSGWRFVPKAVAVMVSQIATERMKGLGEATTQPLRFSERLSFHTFDVCFPSAVLAAVGDEAYQSVVRRGAGATASDVFTSARTSLRRSLGEHGIAVVAAGGDPLWRVALRLEARVQGTAVVDAVLDAWVETAPTDTGADHIAQHRDRLTEWLRDDTSPLRLTEKRLDRLALIAAFSPAICLVRALTSVFPDEADAFLPRIAKVTLGPLRRYFNKPHVQQVLRQHEFKMPWDPETAEDEHGFTDRSSCMPPTVTSRR